MHNNTHKCTPNYVTGTVKINHMSAKYRRFFILALLNVYTTTTKSSSLLHNLMGFLLQLTVARYYILNRT